MVHRFCLVSNQVAETTPKSPGRDSSAILSRGKKGRQGSMAEVDGPGTSRLDPVVQHSPTGYFLHCNTG